VPIAVSEEQRAFAASIQRWAAGAGTIAAVRARETDPDLDHTGHWCALAELGVFALGLPDDVGGVGTVTDLAVALHQIADALVPGPIMPTLLGGLLLARHADLPAVKDLLPALAAGEASVAVGLAPSSPVLCAGQTTHLLLPHEDRWRLVPSAAATVTAVTPVDFSRPLGTVTLSTVDSECLVPLDRREVCDVAALLASVEAVAVAEWAVRTATEYAKSRRQFGRAIGSFQAVKHLCAGMLARSERAAAVAWDATVAYGQSPDEFALAVAAAAGIALDAAVDNAKDCVQVLGGIGFTWEHDAHLYLRRAVALRALHGDGARWRRRAAELALAGHRRTLRVAAAEPDPAVRSAVARIAALPEPARRVALADAGYLTPDWPAPYGVAATPAQQLAIDEELAAQGVTRPDIAIAGWAVPTILRHGTDAQRARFAAGSLRGEIVWCQLFSEPEAGSDLASLRTRAVRVDGGWRLTGQKVWTSLAHEADWGICLARTDPDAPRHRGITYFLVKMDSPGVRIRPLREITGRELFNEVFLDDVFVPDDCVVGQPGDGWRLARGTLENERVAMGRGSSLGEEAEALVEAVRAAGSGADATVAERLGAVVAEGLAVSTLELRATLRRLAGEPPGPWSAVRKLVGVAQRQLVAETALVLAGAAAACVDESSAHTVFQFLQTRCLSIAGGTTQILLTLVGERVLGLPREEVS